MLSHADDVPALEPLTFVELKHGHRLSDTRALEVVERQHTHDVSHTADVAVGLAGIGDDMSLPYATTEGVSDGLPEGGIVDDAPHFPDGRLVLVIRDHVVEPLVVYLTGHALGGGLRRHRQRLD